MADVLQALAIKQTPYPGLIIPRDPINIMRVKFLNLKAVSIRIIETIDASSAGQEFKSHGPSVEDRGTP